MFINVIIVIRAFVSWMEIGGLDNGGGVGCQVVALEWTLLQQSGSAQSGTSGLVVQSSKMRIITCSLPQLWSGSLPWQHVKLFVLKSQGLRRRSSSSMAVHQRGQRSMHHLLPLMLNTVSGREQFVPMPRVVFRHCLGVPE